MSAVTDQFKNLSDTVLGPYKPGKSSAPVETRQLVDPVSAGANRTFGCASFSPYADGGDMPLPVKAGIAGPVGPNVKPRGISRK